MEPYFRYILQVAVSLPFVNILAFKTFFSLLNVPLFSSNKHICFDMHLEFKFQK